MLEYLTDPQVLSVMKSVHPFLTPAGQKFTEAVEVFSELLSSEPGKRAIATVTDILVANRLMPLFSGKTAPATPAGESPHLLSLDYGYPHGYLLPLVILIIIFFLFRQPVYYGAQATIPPAEPKK